MFFFNKFQLNHTTLKSKYIIFYFILAIVDIVAEYYNITSIVTFSRFLIVPAAFIGYLEYRAYTFQKIDIYLTISLLFISLGLFTSYLIPPNQYYITINSVIYFVEIQLQILIIRSFFYSKTNKISDEITKSIIVITVGIVFIYLLFPMMDFWDQIVVFSRVLQFSFFFAYVFRNKNLHLQIELSFWTILISNILSVIVLYIQVPGFTVFLANFLFFTSKILLVNGLILSIQQKQNSDLKPN